jgi:hypothetical protein
MNTEEVRWKDLCESAKRKGKNDNESEVGKTRSEDESESSR